ncbi:protein NnrT [Notoacmeibacter marinus]|uniref:Protein NnrT n=1 Tax=Notoacmeibacter marinus TaxID=1876515 RepID=A0A231UY01_9HYPH|nr:protein NnrT [Notoacmeibacter marinus]OXT00815.1 protein NnrT [Notoacmeibacter marinus]
MLRYLTILLTMAPASALAAGFDRPIPNAQSATAELWFGLATVALIAALALVWYAVRRRP